MKKWERFQNSNLFQAWLVLLLSLVFGTALAGVEVFLGPKIEANKIKETMEKVPVVILGASKAEEMTSAGNSLSIEPFTIEIEKNKRKKSYTVYKANFKDGTLAGFVVKASVQGYADKIELLVGLDSKVKAITGLFVLDQKETPGLGNKIVEEDWQSQFVTQPLNKPLVVVKNGSGKVFEIDAISGATISSRCVTDLVNQTVADLKEKLVLLEAKKEQKEKGEDIDG
ncbi:MAG: FMN-binding protein [Thermodesulfobacteriota bacterium]|nr:FMN-binding protein [Thermodesulfobacteriota bacterium]